MFASRPAVHPLEVAAAPPADPPAQQPQPQQQEQAAEEPQGVLHPQGVLMKDLPGMPGTPEALGLRVAQLLFAGIALAVMTSTDDFPSVTAFCFLVAAVILQVGDMITGGITLSAACAAAGITVLIDNDLDICGENHCAAFESAVAMTFMCWFSIVPTSMLNLLSMARLR